MSGQMLDVKRYQYSRIKIRNKDGKAIYSAGNKDAVARAMLGLDKAGLVEVMNDHDLKDKVGKHAKGKNVGHFRMILGQALRGMVNRGEKVKVQGHVIKDLKQAVPLPSGWTEEKIGKPNGGGGRKKAAKSRKKK